MNKSGVANGTQKLLFIVVKYVVLLLTVLSFVGVVWSGLKIVTTFGSTFDTPVYGKLSEKSQNNGDEQIDTGAEAKLALTTKYGESVMKLLGAHNLDKNLYYDQIIASMLSFSKDAQGKYVDSAENWLNASTKAGKEAQQSIMEFDRAFRQSVYEAAAQKNKAKGERALWITAATTGGGILVSLVIVLVLIQIEVNTRITAESTSSENTDRKLPSDEKTKAGQDSSALKPQAKPSACSKCGAKITDADVFCEGCGNKLK